MQALMSKLMPVVRAGQLLRPPTSNGIQAQLCDHPMTSEPPTGSLQHTLLYQSLHVLPAAWTLICLH